ncbi:endonuclease/exonuclease/phosphatase family protein [bacterium]|nr:endonuclease/exonuclease/phosphatase family protein [bacterium]
MTALIRAMTFNVRGAYFEDHENNWAQRYPLNLRVIHNHDPDLIGMQEVQAPTEETYHEHLKGYAVELGPLTARENSTGHGYRNAIYWKDNRFTKLASGHFYFNEPPSEYGLQWGAVEGRGVTWVRLMDLQTQRPLLHFNTHFPHDSEPARLAGARICLQQLASLRENDEPVIFTGDFNSRAAEYPPEMAARLDPEVRARLDQMPPAGSVYHILLEGGFKDAHIEAGHTDEPNTAHGFQGDAIPQLAMRIDWVLTIGWQVQQSTVITDAAPPLYPSDHYPVMAVLY